MSDWPNDLARQAIVEAVRDTVVEDTPGLVEFDRMAPLGRQAWRRFAVQTTGGSLGSLRDAPAIGAGGLTYLTRGYRVSVAYEAGKNRQSLGRDSELLTDDAERIIAAILRMAYDTPNTGLLRVTPIGWRAVDLPSGGVGTEIDLEAFVRREL